VCVCVCVCVCVVPIPLSFPPVVRMTSFSQKDSAPALISLLSENTVSPKHVQFALTSLHCHHTGTAQSNICGCDDIWPIRCIDENRKIPMHLVFSLNKGFSFMFEHRNPSGNQSDMSVGGWTCLRMSKFGE